MGNTRIATEAKADPQNTRGAAQDDAKRLLTALKMTTTVGAVSLTLAGWGLLARANALAPAQAGQAPPAGLRETAQAAPAQTAAHAAGRDTAAQAQVKLNVVEWVQTRAGDPVAVVRDSRNVLWYVWGPDVGRIEQGLSPEYQPTPVDSVTQTRSS